jgi:hypothetical protein
MASSVVFEIREPAVRRRAVSIRRGFGRASADATMAGTNAAIAALRESGEVRALPAQI